MVGVKAKFKMFWHNENLLNTGEVSFEEKSCHINSPNIAEFFLSVHTDLDGSRAAWREHIPSQP